jgi:hypothetical protein
MSNQLLEQITPHIVTALSSILVIIIGYATACVKKYLAEKTAAIQADAKITELDYYLSKGINLIDIAVKATNQSLVDGIKAASADGKISEEEAVAIFNTTRDNIMAAMTPQIKTSIETIYGDVNNFVKQQIEACVRENRIVGLNEIPTLTGINPTPSEAVPYGETEVELQAPPY